MAITPQDLEQLQLYASGVMDRADHHAGKVKGVALALLGGIIWRAEPNSIRLRQHSGSMANMLWARFGGKDFVFAYNHAAETIEIRDRTQTGAVLFSFDDSASLSTVHAAIGAL